MGGFGSGGHNRKSMAQKRVDGSRIRKRTLDLRESFAQVGEPPQPSCLVTQAARVLWPEVIKVLAENGTLYVTDGIAIAALCSSLALFKKADAAIEKYGSISSYFDPVTDVSTIKMNPAVRIRSATLKELRALWQCFGLDPASRVRLGIARTPSSQGGSVLDSILEDDGEEIVH